MKSTRPLAAITVAGLLALGIGACSSNSGSADAGSAAAASSTTAVGTPTAGRTDSAGTAVTTPGGTGPTSGSTRQKYVLASPTTSKARPASPTATAGGGSADLKYLQVQEPFSQPGECQDDGSTLEMTACVLEDVIDVDSTIDAAQLNRFERTAESGRAALLTEYARWLAGRSKTCNASAASGGSLDQITVAQCLLRVSQARARALGAG